MKALLVIALTVLVDLIGFGLVIPLLTFYAQDFGASPMQATLLMSCYSVAQFVFAPIWGALSDRYGRRPVLLLSIAMTAVMLAAFASAQVLWVLFLTRTLHGVFTANLTVAQAYIADVTTPENRARGMGLFGAAFGVGFAVGPWIGGELSAYGLSAPIWAAAGLAALNFVLASVFLPEPAHRDTGRVRRPAWGTVRGLLRRELLGPAIALSFVLTFSFSMMEASFSLFQEHQHGMNAQQVGRLLGFVGLIALVVQGGLIGPLVRRFGELRLIRVALPVYALGLGLLAVVPPLWPLLLACGLLAVAQSLMMPSLNGLISRSVGQDEQGLVLGANQSLSALARATGPTLAGLLLTRVALPAPFLASAALVVLGAGLIWRAQTPRSSPAPA